MQFGILFSVAIGGAIGSLLRYYVAGAIQSAAWPGFPWGIFFVNISGGFVMGVIAELSALKLNLTPELRAFLTVGILGGYTTFSTYSVEIFELAMVRKQPWLALAYALGSVAAGFVGAALGWAAAETVFPLPKG